MTADADAFWVTDRDDGSLLKFDPGVHTQADIVKMAGAAPSADRIQTRVVVT